MRWLKRIFLSFIILCCLPGVTFARARGGHIGHPSIMNYQPQQGWVYKDGGFQSTWQFLVQATTASINGANQLGSGGKIPLFKLFWSMGYHNWSAALSYNFANSAGQQLQNATLGYNWKQLWVMGGQFAMMYGLANSVADNAIQFLQSPLPVLAFNPGYGIGGQAITFNKHFSLMGSVFIPQLNSSTQGSKPFGEILRGLYVPWHKKGKVLHFGVSLWQQAIDRSHEVGFSAIPEIETTNSASLVDTGDIMQARNYFTADLELALVQGPFNLQSEYIQNWVNRTGGYHNLSFSGYYVNLTYFLNKTISMAYSYPYGYFSGPTQIDQKYGVWQLAAQYSTLDLNNHDIQGGQEQNYTLGANWYLSKHVEFLFDYIRANAHPDSNGRNKDANIFAAEFQLYL